MSGIQNGALFSHVPQSDKSRFCAAFWALPHSSAETSLQALVDCLPRGIVTQAIELWEKQIAVAKTEGAR